MLLRYSFDLVEDANLIENAVKEILSDGLRTGDIMEDGRTQVTTEQMGDAILEKLNVVASKKYFGDFDLAFFQEKD